MKTGRTGGLLAGVVALGLALAAGAETWNDGSRTWRYYITSVQTSVGAWRQGAALQSGDMRWNYETGMYESTPCVEPAPVGALTVPSELPLVTTNGWNEWVGTELVHYETVTTNWLPLVRIGYNAFSGCTSLTSVTLPPTVAEIDSAAFLNCTSLADVTGLDAVRKFDQTAFAGTPWWDAYTNGKEFVVLNGTLFMYNGAGGDVTVPEGVAVIGSNVFSYRSDLRRVVLPASASKIQDSAFTGSSVTDIAWGGVTEIGSSAFANCTGLTSVTLPDALTSISWGTFQGCSQLATVRGGASVTSVGMNAFSGTPLTDPAAASFKLGVIGSVLYGYAGTAAGAVDIPEGVATLSDAYMFKGNTAITALTLPSTLVDNALYSEMFRDCTSLREVVIKSTRYSSSIPSRMFMGCTALTSVTLPANLWSIGESAFEDCDALATIDLPKSLGRLYEKAFAYSGLETVTGAEGLYSVGSGAFEGTPLLDRQADSDFVCIGSYALEYWGGEEMVVPDGITRLDSGIFGYDLNITSISLPAGVALSMWNLRRCPYLESVEFRDGAVIDGCVTRDGVVYSENGLMLSFCPPGRSGTFDIPDGVRWIESSAFSGCGELTSVTIPASVRGMGSYAFESCYGLTSITLPDSLRALPGGAFADCESLEDVAGGQNLFEVGAGAFSGTPFLDEADGLVQVGNVVVGCGAEVDPRVLQIPEGVTAIANGAFSDQGEIASVKLPASLKRIGDYAFSDCGNLAQVTGGENLTEIGAYAFYNCTALTAFDIPAGVKSLCYAVFEDCASLATVTGGAGLEGRVERSAFYSTPFLEETPGAVVLGGCLLQYNGDCPESYSVPAGVTDISDEVFCGQDALATLTLPAGLKSIGLCAFEGCESLTTVVGGADVESIGSGAFAGTPYGEDEELNPGYRVLGRCLWGYTGSCAPSPFVIPDGVFVVGTGDGGGFSFDDGEVSELRIPSSVKRINELGNLAPCAITGGAGLEDVSRWSVDLRNLPEPADGFLRVGSVVVGTSGLDVEALGGRLVIPEGVTAIGAGAFEEQLEEVSHVKLPGSLRRINRDAFAYCWCLESIDLGAAVEEVADWAFYGCWSLTRLTVANPDIRFGANAFYDCFGLDEVAAPVKGGYVFGGWTTDTGRDFGADLAMAFTREEEEEGWGPYAKVFANWIESAEAGAADLPEEATGIPAEAPPPVLFDNPVAGEFDGGDIFTGWLKNASGQIVGTISIKAGKPNKSGVSKLTATIVRIGDKKLTLKGECAIGSGVQAELTGGAGVATIRFGAEGFVGEFGDCTIEGGRNVFAARDEDARARAALFAKWIGVYTVALLPRPVVTGTVSVRGWCGLSVVVGKGGKAKVSGTMPDGQKVSASVQLIAGDHGAACVPVLAQLYSGKKGGFAFLLWLQDDGIRVTNANEWDATGSKVPFKAEWDEIRAGRPGTVRTDAVFAVDAASASLPMGAVRSDLLPVAEALVADDRRWKTAEKPSRVDKEGVAAGGNPSALKVSYTAKQGAFKGSFKAFYDDRATGKLKSESATVTGVVVEGVGYGTANLKKNGAWPVEVR